MTTSTIAVVGGGLMGHGIAYLFAAAGHPVRVFDPDEAIRRSLPMRLGLIADLLEHDSGVIERIAVHDQLETAAAGSDLVVEAAPEKLALKRKLFAELEAIVRPDTILASNSSAIPSTEIGRHLLHRDRVIGTHFWNPPHLVPLVEVVQTEWTSAETVTRTMEVLRRAGKRPVHVRRDIPGFIGNRLQHALKREAIALLAAGVADAETIDTVVKDGFGARLAVLGPLEQSDLVGLDLTLDIQETLVPHLDRAPEVNELLRQKVAEGKLGMKTGEGFRRWTPEEAEAVRERLGQTLVDLTRR
ncbi:3-hydroxyacyl-CoA dehydrogenase NAD-binding domain-containing protein [Rhodoplanes sp.]|uniref:3-hydroxyacyl-CoA dehydrogenase family protein n=1 Tax=Rhodoplanes sp. TaxID=1968906 RepID=UPI0025F89AFA|nr:3-hydroxyacyl-CoA dehydrogenase NAD-binding domain-containing protein [Rhodoplanes sp.]